MYGTAVYGHGGRLGYEKDWRCDPKLVSGGELLDQGIHLADLFRWFLGEVEEGTAYTATSFWPIQPLDDNGFATLKMKGGQVASFHVSWSRWRNRFYFEIFGQTGYVQVTGLGGSYGVETLVVGRRAPQFGAPTEEKKEFPGEDVSWVEEWKDFVGAIREQRQPFATGRDGWMALKTVSALYEAARSGRSVKI
jgi:predicted dehydrogenase